VSVLVTILALRKAEPHGARVILNALVMLSTVLYGALAQLTGGIASPLFHWILTLPIVVALVIPDQPDAVAWSGFTLVIYGAAMQVWEGEAPGTDRALGVAGGGGDVAGVLRVGDLSPPAHARSRARPTPRRSPPRACAPPRRRSPRATNSWRSPAHELRTPLTSMLLHIEAIERTLPAESAPRLMQVPPTEQKRIAAVARQARRLSGLIDSMLDVSKLTGGHLSLELAELDVSALVREVTHRFAPDASAAECKLSLHLDQPVMAVLDGNRLDQIVSNLVGNALKYGAGSPVDVGVEGDDTGRSV
jgi:hypothetical protein